MTNAVRSDWKEIQEKTFTNWCNDVLKGGGGKAKGKQVNDFTVLAECHGLCVYAYPLSLTRLQTSVENLTDDLQDGLALIQILETLAAPRKVGPYHKNPKIKPQIMENLGACMKFLNKEGIKLVNIGV